MKKIGNILVLVLILAIVVLATQIEQPIIAKGASLELVSDQFAFTEGPAADRFGNVYFTDQPNDRIYKWGLDNSIALFMDSCGRSNGLYFDHDYALLACADEKNQLWSIDVESKEVEVLVKDFENLKLNGPNDMWVDPEGGIYFSDPFYLRDYWSDTTQVLKSENVYYLSPDRQNLKVVASNLVKPNGLIGTPDGNTLFVADIGDWKTYSYHIDKDGRLTNRMLFCEMGSDGMTIDYKGNIYLTNKGVHVFNRRGEEIEHIEIDQNWTANVTFGGPEFKTLFITAMNSVYTIDMNVKGVRY